MLEAVIFVRILFHLTVNRPAPKTTFTSVLNDVPSRGNRVPSVLPSPWQGDGYSWNELSKNP